jgi:hypothetical protein
MNPLSIVSAGVATMLSTIGANDIGAHVTVACANRWASFSMTASDTGVLRFCPT